MRLSPSSATSTRALAIDQARGIAVVAMIVYHFAWDLSHFDLIEADVTGDPGWKLFAQAIAASFLFISGLSLALAAAKGFDPRGFLKRLALIGGAAALITLTTFFVFPDRYIFFGILHCIAAASVLALPFMRMPAWVALVAGAAIVALPHVASAQVFDAPALRWVGLGTVLPESNDYVPIFPWAGFVLLGLAFGRLAGAWLTGLPALPAPGLARLGRWSLAIYLVHQPLLFGATMLAARSDALAARRDAVSFVTNCASHCQAAGGRPSACAAACRCAAERLRPLPIWRNVLANTLTESEQSQTDAIGAACYREAVSSGAPSAKP